MTGIALIAFPKLGYLFIPRRKVLKGIASCIASRFISRKNDVDGCWALGVLYKLALEACVDCVSLNLIARECAPGLQYAECADYLGDKLMKKGMTWERVESAIIVVEFNVLPTKRQILFKSTWGEPFVCRVCPKDDLGRA